MCVEAGSRVQGARHGGKSREGREGAKGNLKTEISTSKRGGAEGVPKEAIAGGTPAITRGTRVIHPLATLAGSSMPGMIFMHMTAGYHGGEKAGVLS